jgi:integrase
VPSNGDAARVAAPASLLFTAKPLLRHLADLPVDQFTSASARAYCKSRRAEAPRGRSGPYRQRPLADGTLIKELGHLRTALAWAVRQKWIAKAPFVERPTAAEPKLRWLTEAEFQTLYDATSEDHQRLFLMLAVYTAARKSAILELEWTAVDWSRRTLDFGPARGKKVRPRHQPIVPALYDALVSAKKTARTAVVVESGGMSVSSISKGFTAIAKRAGLVGVTPHTLKHTAISWMMQAGVPVAEISKFSATSIPTIMRVYGHLTPDYMQNAVAALGQRLVLQPPHIPPKPPKGDLRIVNANQRAAMLRLRSTGS